MFTDRAFGGNQLAVFTNGRGISSELMQLLIKELNLSEATYVLPPSNPANTYRVRIFTPAKELPLAGHPTIGTAFILAREHMIEREGDSANIVFEEGVGDIPVSIQFNGDQPGMIWMTQPNPQFGRQANDVERADIAAMLSLSPDALDRRYPIQTVSAGVPFMFVPIRDLASVRNIKMRADINERVMGDFGTTEVFVFTTEVENSGSTVHSRMFAPMLGVTEDAATGGATGPLGAYLVRYGIGAAAPTTRMVSEQGIEMGRPSFLHIEVDQQGSEITAVRVGGQCHYMGEGAFEVE